MKLSDIIEQFLLDSLSEADDDITLRRNELAGRFSCAPSQINYVIGTRFTGQRGYSVESQRGGGGYIRIRRVNVSQGGYIMHIVNSIGNSLDYPTMCALISNMAGTNVITEREEKLMQTALSDRSIPLNLPERDRYRAAMFKDMLVSLI